MEVKVEVKNLDNYELDYYGTYLILKFKNNLELTLSLDALAYYHKEKGRRGLFPLLTRGESKKKHAELRKKLGLSKKEYSRLMGKVGGLLSSYLSSY